MAEGPAKVAKTAEQVAILLRHCLDEGCPVEIDGLGTFRPGADGAFEFVPDTAPKVFLAYVQEDADAAERLFREFRSRGFDPWLDRKKLLPGQNWPRAIEQAIALSDYFLACFSRRSIQKKGQFHAELRYALDCAARVPVDRVFFIPVRLDDCAVPWIIRREIQYVDLFPDWDTGMRRILAAMQRAERPEGEKLPLAG